MKPLQQNTVPRKLPKATMGFVTGDLLINTYGRWGRHFEMMKYQATA